MRKIVSVFLAALLFSACANNMSESVDKVLTTSKRNGIAFQNIDAGSSAEGTSYGWDIIKFNDTNSYAIMSVPGSTPDNQIYLSVYFNAIMTPGEASPEISIMTYYGETSPFSLALDTSINWGNNIHVSVVGEENVTYKIGIYGTFTEYKQENILFCTYMEERERQVMHATHKELNTNELNTVYIMPYPWRNIKVLVEDITLFAGYGCYPAGVCVYTEDKLIEWVNNNVFKQAICKIVDVTDDYDCKVSFSKDVKGVKFYDETGKEYNEFTSNRAASAVVEFNDTLNNLLGKRTASAIAFMMGVTLSGEDGEYNLMKNVNDADSLHLNFRQWNQLRAKIGKM